MGKRNNVWVARECAKLAREILGANGIVDDYPVIRHMLNIESVYTYEGTHDIHGLVIGEAVTGIPSYNPPMVIEHTEKAAKAGAGAGARSMRRDQRSRTGPHPRHRAGGDRRRAHHGPRRPQAVRPRRGRGDARTR